MSIGTSWQASARPMPLIRMKGTRPSRAFLSWRNASTISRGSTPLNRVGRPTAWSNASWRAATSPPTQPSRTARRPAAAIPMATASPCVQRR